MLMSLTACAPVVYDATHYQHRTPTHVIVRSTHTQPSRYHQPVYHQVHPIEVTLYAGNTYLGVSFQPIKIVIADGEYVEIPIRNKRGRQTKIYAHYHQKSLHFDADRNCRSLYGSSKYKYDKRWGKGHKYTRINAGKDYDFNGLQLRIRNVPTGKRQAKKNELPKVIGKKVVVRNNYVKKPIKQQVNRVLVKDNGEKPSIRKQNHSIDRRSTKVSDYYAQDKQRNKVKVLTTKVKSVVKADKKVKRPAIIERINRHEKSKYVRDTSQKPAVKNNGLIHKREKKQTVEVIVKNKNQSTKADREVEKRNKKSWYGKR
jgi:hypothetical protein